MKKVVRTILLLCILSLSGCDFLRSVAGRPTSRQVQEKSRSIQMREAFVRDSIENASKAAPDFGVQLSSVFSFGTPDVPLQSRYNIIIGVYRTLAPARSQMVAARHKGFDPFYITFHGGKERAVCLFSSDDADQLSVMLEKGRAAGVCPKDAWIFENK